MKTRLDNVKRKEFVNNFINLLDMCPNFHTYCIDFGNHSRYN